MKIAVFAMPKYGGTGLYRLYLPHEMMAKWGHKIMFTDSSEPKDYEGFDIFIASKSWFVHVNDMIPKLRSMGIKTIIDFDDYWVLPSTHYLYDVYRANNTSKIIARALYDYEYVICTTDILRDKISGINKNIAVLPNAIDPKNPQFIPRPSKSETVRFGWIGGHCHYFDILQLDTAPRRLEGDFRITLFGHDGRENSVYDSFCEILSGRGILFDTDPKKSKFRVVRQLGARQYTLFYNTIDVALAPLVDDTFNSMKSELKMIEAGFFKKGLVVSDVKPYSRLITPDNCMAVHHKNDWAKHMNKLIKNPNRIKDMGEALYETVKTEFDLERVTRVREQFYESIL